jgi:hypothetical protein
MRLPSSEKLEIIRLVEQSHLPARRTLEVGIQRSTFYRWYDRFRLRAGSPRRQAIEAGPGLEPHSDVSPAHRHDGRLRGRATLTVTGALVVRLRRRAHRVFF